MKNTSIGMKNLISHINTALNNNLFLTAFAEENPAEPPKNEGNTMNFEQLIAQARREEKEKLYPQIEKLKAQAEVLTKQVNEALLAKGAVEKELADLKESQKKGDNEEVTKLKAQVEALKSENEDLKKNTVSEEDLFDFYNTVERLAPQVIAEKRHIYKGVSTNVDFYSGFVYHMLDIPVELYTPMFAIARVVGWSAHRMEELPMRGTTKGARRCLLSL